MNIDIDVVTGPAFLASALVNGDTSGLDEAGLKTLERFESQLGDGWHVVDVDRDANGEGQESRFTWHFDLYGGDARGGDVIDYVVERVS